MLFRSFNGAGNRKAGGSMRIINEVCLNKDVDATLGAETVYSDTIDLAHQAGYSLHLRVVKNGGVVAGNAISQKSNNGVNWIDVTTTALTDTATQSIPIEVVDVFYRYVRLKVDLSTGVASFVADVMAKGF